MPRKYFRKYLPSHQSVRENRLMARFGKWLHDPRLWHLHRRCVAGGVGVGLFCGLIPGPFQMLGAGILAIALRVNLPVALLVTLYTNPFTIVPLYLLAYQIGKLFVSGHGTAIPKEELSLMNLPLEQWIPALLDWMSSLGKPLLVGLPILATLLAVSGWVLVLAAWRLYLSVHWRRRKRARFAREVAARRSA